MTTVSTNNSAKWVVPNFVTEFEKSHYIREIINNSPQHKELLYDFHTQLINLILDAPNYTGNLPRNTTLKVEVRKAYYPVPYEKIRKTFEFLLKDSDFFNIKNVKIIRDYLNCGWAGIEFIIPEDNVTG